MAVEGKISLEYSLSEEFIAPVVESLATNFGIRTIGDLIRFDDVEALRRAASVGRNALRNAEQVVARRTELLELLPPLSRELPPVNGTLTD